MEKIIQSTGFFRAKTTSIIALGQALCDRFGGEVPSKMKDLVTLPGVGRKTANVVLGNAFGVPGITVDTHFARLSHRFGWTGQRRPRQDRGRGGLALPAVRMDRAVAPGDLAWPAGVSRAHPGVRRVRRRPLCPSFGLGPTDPEVAKKLVKEGPFS